MRSTPPSTALVSSRVTPDWSPLVDRCGPKIVAFGGRSGLPVVLEGLKYALSTRREPGGCESAGDQLTAIVTVTDDGGSSGRLRQSYGVLPPGDIRNCLLALADPASTLAPLFDFRFDGSGDISGHSLGNLILTALGRLETDFGRAIERGSKLLGAHGRVLPSTLRSVTLRAEFEDGSWIEGESRIPSAHRTIRKVTLEPREPGAFAQAVEAALYADLVVIGPGSLYTSLIPVVLVKELTDAIRQSSARVVLVMNLTTEPGETDRYTAADHILAIRRHAPQLPIHDVLLNETTIPDSVKQKYSTAGATPVTPDVELLRALGYRPVMRELLASGPMIRHDPHKLARAVLERLDRPSGVTQVR
jgi:uncharacterized cofD-like protein